MSTFEMYQQVRKLNTDLYWNPKTQLQMKLDAQAMGKEFFRKDDLTEEENAKQLKDKILESLKLND